MSSPEQARTSPLLRLFPSLAAGLVCGLIIVIVDLAFAALVFSGDLAVFRPDGIGLILFASLVLVTIMGMTTSFPALIGSVQDGSTVILALAAAVIAREMPASATPHQTYVTVVVALGLSAVLTGGAFLLLGQFRLGELIRFIPYPVIGGFLAGTGLLLVFGSLSVMVDQSVDVRHLSPLVGAESLVRWLPGLAMALALLITLRRIHHTLVIPGTLLAGVAVFYAVLWISGESVSRASAEGWLISGLPGGGLWNPVGPSDLSLVEWRVIGQQAGSMIAVVVISTITLLLNASGLELATRRDADLNHELKAAGLANVAAGLVGGMPGSHILSVTALAHRMGGRSRLVGLVLAAVLVVVLLAGGTVLSYFPTPVLGGLLLFLGMDFLITWVIESWPRLPRLDYAVVILILLAMNLAGLLEGVALGLVLALVLFVASYSRVSVVKYALTGAQRHSNVVRPRLYRQLLNTKGHWLYIVKLHGFIFFGTANRLFEQVRQQIAGPETGRPRYVLLDFSLVTGVDSSAVFSLSKLKQATQAREIILIFTGLSPVIRRQLARDVLVDEPYPLWRAFPDMDHGIEWCENMAINTFESTGLVARPKTLLQQLEETMLDPAHLKALLRYLTPEEVTAGTVLVRQGDPPQGMIFIERGQVTVQLEGPGGAALRVRKMGLGTLVGELGTYLNRPATATVIADEPCTIYRLSSDVLRRMEVDDPDVAAAFHRFMAHLLAERVVQTTETLQALAE